MVWVEKKDGKKERFTAAKIARSIVKAGGTVELAGEVADAVSEKISESREKLVKTSKIKSYVLSFLAKFKPRIAGAYSHFNGKKQGAQ